MKIVSSFKVREVSPTPHGQEVVHADGVSGDTYGAPHTTGGVSFFNANPETFGQVKAGDVIQVTIEKGSAKAAPNKKGK